MANNTSDKFLWVCELTKDEPNKVWKANDLVELEDEDDRDFVINSLAIKTAVLGASAVDNERNIVAIKTNGYQNKPIEQPIFSLTLGRNDMISGLDLTIAGDQDVEFKLVSGTGPVYITCTHIIDMPPPEDQPTIMTNSDIEIDDEESEEIEEEEAAAAAGDEEDDDEPEEKAKDKKRTTKNGNGAATAPTTKTIKELKAANGKNGEHKKEEVEIEEKPNKRKRN